jgi:hypothetical protein
VKPYPEPVTGIDPHADIRPPAEPGPWWWACSAPERPHEVWTLYAAADCAPCRVALMALASQEPDAFMDRRDPDTGEVIVGESSAAAELKHHAELAR